MAIYGKTIDVTYMAFNTNTNEFVDDNGTHVIQVYSDNGNSTKNPMNNLLANGQFELTLTDDDMKSKVISLSGVTTSDDVILIFGSDIITEQNIINSIGNIHADKIIDNTGAIIATDVYIRDIDIRDGYVNIAYENVLNKIQVCGFSFDDRATIITGVQS